MNAAADRGYYAVSKSKRLEYAGMYLGLVALLAVMSYETHEMLATTRVPTVWYAPSGR
jgi:hypothetical protein